MTCELPAYALGGISQATQNAAPRLNELLSHSDQAIRINAAYGLGGIGQSATMAVPNLVRTLNDSHIEVRISAVHTLGQIRAEVGVSSSIPSQIRMSGFV